MRPRRRFLDQRRRHRLAQFELQRRETRAYLRQHTRQQIGRDRRDDAEPEAPFHGDPSAPGDALDLAACSDKHAFDARLHRLRLVGQPHRLAAAFEQPATQPFLHFGDLRRKRRLAHAGQFRRAAEMQGLRQRVEIFHLPDGQPDHKRKPIELY